MREALAVIGVDVGDIRLAANCHLHFDHCGGNPLLGQIPVFVQGIELDAARQTEDYTLPELIEGNAPAAGPATSESPHRAEISVTGHTPSSAPAHRTRCWLPPGYEQNFWYDT